MNQPGTRARARPFAAICAGARPPQPRAEKQKLLAGEWRPLANHSSHSAVTHASLSFPDMRRGVRGRQTRVKMAASVAGWAAAALLLLVAAAAGPGVSGRSQVRALSDGTWRELLEGEWMVELAETSDLDAITAPLKRWTLLLSLLGLSGRFIITALPTIYHCKDGEFRRYQGSRTKTDFINFISDQEWKSIEPVSTWLGPSSFLMSSMSALFQLSIWIRHCHNYFTENLGMPAWGSYAVFALVTLFSGLLLGLLMVFLADCLCPSKRTRPPPYPYHKTLPESAEPWRQLVEEAEPRGGHEAEPDNHGPRTSSPDALRQRAVPPAAGAEKS
uniref:Thioredoxin- transmembrane protein 1 n=1 Tax=Sphaerodactylus townsendi TaxID=933632 RepID=A0ACB8G6V7_9SAUR